MKVGFKGLTENIVYVRPHGDVPKRATGKALGCCQWKKTTQKGAFKKVWMSL